jgi:hypothetical protein
MRNYQQMVMDFINRRLLLSHPFLVNLKDKVEELLPIQIYDG